jgi:GNAT superfamily N-acetyltransferase/predicted nucleic acid-binding protein
VYNLHSPNDASESHSARRSLAKINPVVIKCAAPDVTPFVETARSHADRERDALGFLPAPVYDDAAGRGNLLVALITTDASMEYAGHLLFGGTFPHARIFQLFVSEQFRNRGIARQLIQFLINMLEQYGYLSTMATVAEDLIANGFWEKLGFFVARQKPGGVNRKRLLNIRIKQLNSPTLFHPQLSSIASDLGLVERLGTHTAVYAIDLNVFWDVVKRRPRSEYAADVIGAAFNRLIQVVVAQEFINELQRTSRPEASDPALEFAMQLPTLPEPDSIVLQQLRDELGTRIFPNRSKAGTLRCRDQSDLVHLATAIHHRTTGFVTSEDALLRVRDFIYSRYGVSVLHVKEFSALVKSTEVSVPPLAAQLSSDTLRVWDSLSSHSEAIRKFLDNSSAPPAFRSDFLAAEIMSSARKRMIVTSDSDIVCLGSWDAGAGLHNLAHVNLIANEDNAAVEAALDCILGIICAEASRTGPVLLRLCLPAGHVIARKVASSHGFRTTDPTCADGDLQKICVGRPIHTDNWSTIRTAVHYCGGLDFPDALPSFISHDQSISFRTSQGLYRDVKLNDLEKLLSPTLIILPGRAGNIVPIRRMFADQLLGASRQLSLLPKCEALLFSERIYFSASRNANLLRTGMPLLFYESGRAGGCASVTACARVVQTRVLKKLDISSHLLRHGVLESDDLEQLTTTDSTCVTMFDNIMLFDKPVPLERLRELSCVDASNLVSSRQISNQQFVSVLKEGFPPG